MTQEKGKMAIRTIIKRGKPQYVVGYAVGDSHFKIVRMTPEGVIGPDGTIPMVYKSKAEAQRLIDYMKSVIIGLE